jgi:uncharacterized protein involved in response to NO
VKGKQSAVWLLYARASVALAVMAGFGLGAGLFGWVAAGERSGLWWAAAAQAHGHVQIFGWGGLMILGVALHFLPRLLSVDPASLRWAVTAFWAMASGLVVRAVAQPAMATSESDLWRVLLVGSAAMTLVGAVIAIAALAATIVRSDAMERKPELRAIAPFFALAIANLLLALGLDLYGVIDAARDDSPLIGPRIGEAIRVAGFYGFVLPVGAAMSVRLFPLYARTRPLGRSAIRVVAGLVLAGLALRLTAIGAGAGWVEAVAGLVQALGLIGVVAMSGVARRRRPLPRKATNTLREPLQWHLAVAAAWLVVAALLLLARSGERIRFGGSSPSVSTEWHALGAGYMTLLIVGVGQVLLPGFARKTMRDARVLWLTLGLGGGAAVLRVVPGWIGTGDSEATASLRALAGVVAMAALVAFSWNARLLDRSAQNPVRTRDSK